MDNVFMTIGSIEFEFEFEFKFKHNSYDQKQIFFSQSLKFWLDKRSYKNQNDFQIKLDFEFQQPPCTVYKAFYNGQYTNRTPWGSCVNRWPYKILNKNLSEEN